MGEDVITQAYVLRKNNSGYPQYSTFELPHTSKWQNVDGHKNAEKLFSVCNVIIYFLLWIFTIKIKFVIFSTSIKNYSNYNMYKGTGLRYIELLNGLQIVRDSLAAIGEGKKYQVVALSSQLRGLLVLTKSTPNPILHSIANTLEIDISLYLPPKEDIQSNLLVYNHLLKATTEPTQSNKQKISLKQWLATTVVRMNCHEFSISDVIKTIADKNGGAHYDEKLPTELAMLCSGINKQGVLVTDIILIEVAKIIIQLGIKILKSEFDFQYFIDIVVKVDNIVKKKNIITYYGENKTYTPISIYIDEGRSINLKLQDSNGLSFTSALYENVISGRYIIMFGYELKDNMQPELVIYRNDKIIKHGLNPLLFIYNRFVHFPNQIFSDDDIEIAFGAIMAYKNVLSIEDTVSVYKHMMENRENVLCMKGKQSATVMPNGDIKFDVSGNRKHTTIKAFLSK